MITWICNQEVVKKDYKKKKSSPSRQTNLISKTNAKEFLNFKETTIKNYFLIIVIEIKEIFIFKDFIKSLI